MMSTDAEEPLRLYTIRHDVFRRRRAPRGYTQSGMMSIDAEEPPCGYTQSGMMSIDAEEPPAAINNPA
jgi:hypothetical protein